MSGHLHKSALGSSRKVTAPPESHHGKPWWTTPPTVLPLDEHITVRRPGHGLVAGLCCVVDQLAYARAAADSIPALEAELETLEAPHWLDREPLGPKVVG